MFVASRQEMTSHHTFVLIIGTLLCVLIAAAFVVSARWQIAFQVPRLRGPGMFIMGGSVLVTNDKLISVLVAADTHRRGLDRWNSWEFDRFTIREGPASRPTSYVMVEFQLFAPFLAALLPTLFVWRFVAKFPRGHCRRCGYNLKGLTEARCPECGAGFEKMP